MRVNRWVVSLTMTTFLLECLVSFSDAQQRTTPTPQPTRTMPGMSTMGDMETEFSSDEFAPLVRGIYDGQEVLFIHTEASDPDVAALLTEMMGPEVIAVPSLADVPEELLGNVYVFTNGVSGGGPMGFQPDVFDSVPGDPEYTPLRALNLVTWRDDARPRVLENVAEIEAAHSANAIEIEQPGVVINMPILVWPEGHR